MTEKKKNIIRIGIFFIVALISIIFIVFANINYDYGNWDYVDDEIYDCNTISYVKVGDKIPFIHTNKDLGIMDDNKDVQYVKSQIIYCLSDESLNEKSAEIGNRVYIDDNGDIVTNEAGVYKLSYVFSAKRSTQLFSIITIKRYIFNSIICIYEGDNNKLEPLPEQINNMKIDGNYILDKDMTWETTGKEYLDMPVFKGTILNPNGYTLTWKIKGDKKGNTPQSLIYENKGYIDGLNLKIETVENFKLTDDFYCLYKYNTGVIKNCKIEGKISMDDKNIWNEELSFYPISNTGFCYDNEVKMTVYGNEKIYSYIDNDGGYSREQKKSWQSVNNKVFIDAWWEDGNVKAQRREIPRSNKEGITCEHLAFGKVDNASKKQVILNVPINMYSVGKKYYLTNDAHVYKNSPLDVITYFGENAILYTDGKTQKDEIEIKYWLVNGEKKDNLNDIVVLDDLIIEPVIKYKETLVEIGNGTGKIHSVEDILYLGDYDYKEPSICFSDIGNVLRDPRNIIPKEIIIASNVGINNEFVDDTSLYFILDYLQNGGKLTIESGNKYLSWINEKFLCSADGRSLLYYFNDKDEKEVVLHSQFEEIKYKNTFFGGENFISLDFSNVSSIDPAIGEYLPNLKNIIVGKNIKDSKVDVNSLFSGMTALENIEISIENAYLKEKDGFVWSLSSEEYPLLFAMPNIEGEVKIPEGVKSNPYMCFSGRDITIITFPSSFGIFYEKGLEGIDNLEKIVFGASPIVKFEGKAIEFSNLKEIEFSNETTSVEFSNESFSLSKVQTIKLPLNLNEVKFTPYCEKYVISNESPYYKTVDGVVYSKNGEILTCYPKYKKEDKYIVLDETKAIGENAFLYSDLKEIVLPNSCYEIYYSAFIYAKVEKIEFKTNNEIQIGEMAFFSCENLLEIIVSENSSLSVGRSSFYGCKELNNFPFDKTIYIDRMAFMRTGIEYLEVGNSLEYVGFEAFAQSQIKEVVYKNNDIKNIEFNTFANTPLESVDLGCVTNIGNNAFINTVNLKLIDLSNVTTIGERAFEGSGITEARGENVVKIADSFKDCENLKQVDFPKVASLMREAFKNSGIVNVNMPNLKTIGEQCFENCKDLETIVFGDNVKIKDSAFLNCEKLKTIDGKIENVETHAFKNCKSLTEITINGSVEKDCYEVFSGCENLLTVRIIGVIIDLSEKFFNGCLSLEKVYITQREKLEGYISPTTFGADCKAEVYLTVYETFTWKGKIPDNMTVYVPVEGIEIFKTEWLYSDEQIKEMP